MLYLPSAFIIVILDYVLGPDRIKTYLRIWICAPEFDLVSFGKLLQRIL